MRNRLILVALFLFLHLFIFGQEHRKTIDSLTTGIIEGILKDSPTSAPPNDSLEKKKSSFNAYPYAFYTPETQVAFGAGGIYIFYTSENKDLKPSKIGFGGYYSTNKQYKISMNNVYYFFDNKLYFHLPLSYGYFINKYWGIGNNTPEYDSASYSMKSFNATLTVQLPPEWFSAERTGIIFDFDNTEIVDKMGNELLENDSLPGSNGARLFGVGSDLLWDNRDNIFYPTTGNYQYFKVLIYPGTSDYTYGLIQLDVKHFRSFGKKNVLAGNLYLESAFGETPFYKLPSVGGKQMRGYFYGRYRDNFYAMVQLEYRHFFSERWGFVVFGGLGDVADNMLNYNLERVKYSYGTGIRFMFNKKEKVNVRADIGFGIDGNTGVYFGIEEAF